MPALPIASFRAAFPAFTADEYPDSQVLIRLTLADQIFSETLWGEIRNHAMGLYTAHYLMAYGSKAVGGSGTGGSINGVVSSKSVDGASVSFDTGNALWANAGFWNTTPYGRELYQLMQVFGAGARQL